MDKPKEHCRIVIKQGNNEIVIEKYGNKTQDFMRLWYEAENITRSLKIINNDLHPKDKDNNKRHKNAVILDVKYTIFDKIEKLESNE